jgi:hypothetical protein
LLLTCPLVLDVPANLVGDLDRDAIKRARELLTDATMTDIMNEDPQGPEAFQTALRHHIVTICTRLRISLIIINKLMAVSVAITKKHSN